MVVVGEDRFFSNGLDLEGLAADPEGTGAVVEDVHRLFGRLLLFPAYTVAALNGHTFAGARCSPAAPTCGSCARSPATGALP